MTHAFDFDYDVPADADVTIDLPPGHKLVDYDVTPIPAGAGEYGGTAANKLASALHSAGLSPDQIRGIQAMNEVEGGLFDPQSTLGFTTGQLGGGSAIDAFLDQQWKPRTAKGIPGVDKSGNVKDWDSYMKFIREDIVGQKGIVDWQGNQQPPAADYQNRLMTALPHFQHGGGVGSDQPSFPFPMYTGEDADPDAVFRHNAPFAKPGPYQTSLSQKDESAFRQWVTTNHVNFNPNDPKAAYDMRGYWKDTHGAPGAFYSDQYKTPYDTDFSTESKYSTPNSPFRWRDPATLMDIRDGSIIFFNPSHYASDSPNASAPQGSEIAPTDMPDSAPPRSRRGRVLARKPPP